MSRFVDAVSRLRLVGLVMGCAALVLVGCGGTSSPATTADGGAIDVTGSWNGMATDSKGGIHPMTMVVTQTGSAVAGTGTFDAKTTTITGSVSGAIWSGMLADGANKLATYSLTVAGNAVNGTGTAASDGSSATLKLTR
jgi:hypothetical protein